MMLPEPSVLDGAVAITILIGVAGSWLKWIRPIVRSVKRDTVAARDSLLGREAVHDSITGREISPAIPGIGVRVDSTERHLADLARAMANIADSHRRIEDHETRIGRLEAMQMDRNLARTETIELLRTLDTVAKQKPSKDEK